MANFSHSFNIIAQPEVCKRGVIMKPTCIIYLLGLVLIDKQSLKHKSSNYILSCKII